ncbi:MAG: hypothetical protein J1G02_00245 [Clostridiales bacterium]|nr:hypothetical protein [Clostridiales bacterium]
MKRYLSLVRLMFLQQFKTRATAEGVKKKRGGSVVLIVILAVCFTPLVVAIAVSMYYMGKLSNGNVYVGTYLTLNCQGLVLMFGLHTIISNVFTVRDADKLLYLPVRAHVIFLSKLTVAYLNEIITTAASIVCMLLPFGIGAGVGATYYLMLLVALVLIPMLPMLIGCIIAMPLSALIASFGKNSVFRTVLRIAIYLLVIGLYMYVMYNFGFLVGTENGNILVNPELYIQSVIDDFIARMSSVMPYFHPNYMMMSSMFASSFTGWIVGFVVTIVEHLALLALVVLIALPFYKRLLVLSLEDGGGAIRKNGKEPYKLRNTGVVRGLVMSDLRRTARDGQMGFQSFAGIVMMPIVVVLLYVFMGLSDEGDTSFLQLMSLSPYYQVVGPLIILAYMTFVGLSTNVLGLYPISRENKSVAILKSLPVSFKKILLSKVVLATAVMVVSDFVTCLLIVVLLRIKWYYGLAMLVSLSLIGFGSMCITTLLDLKYPRFGWANYNQSLKTTKNGWIAMLIGLVTIVEIALISVMFVVWYSLTDAWYVILFMWLMIFAAMFVFAVVAYMIMTKRANKYFENIEI